MTWRLRIANEEGHEVEVMVDDEDALRVLQYILEAGEIEFGRPSKVTP